MILKQRNIGTVLGMLKIVIGQATPYINWLSLGLVGIMSFYTTLNPLFASWGIQLAFWMFLVVLVVFVVAILILEWVFMLPSYFGAANVQSWEHENPQRELLEKMDREIQELKAMIKELEK